MAMTINELPMLPQDILLQIASYLVYSDLTSFIRLSKAFYSLAEPLLWTHIDTHCHKYHNLIAYNVQDDSVFWPMQRHKIRRRIEDARYTLDNCATMAAKFFRILRAIQNTDALRFAQLTCTVRTLCITIGVDSYESSPDYWNIIPAFVNLEALEIISRWIGLGHLCPIDPSFRPLERLKTVTLKGYFPLPFLHFLLLDSGSKLASLFLALLDQPFPIPGYYTGPCYNQAYIDHLRASNKTTRIIDEGNINPDNNDRRAESGSDNGDDDDLDNDTRGMLTATYPNSRPLLWIPVDSTLR